MQIEEFALATWLNEYETDVQFNLAASTGPLWTIRELLALENARVEELAGVPLNYVHAGGTRELRRAVAEFYGGIDPDWVQITTGSAEALWLILFTASEKGRNVIVPRPCYPAFDAIPRSLGAEVRYWHFRAENHFRPDLDELRRLADGRTAAIVVNTPHNPTGIVLEPAEVRAVAGLAAERGIQFVADEVYHGIYYDGRERSSAVTIPTATVTGDISKAFSLAGLRIGWIVERNAERRHTYYNARSYVNVSSGALNERLAAVAVRQHQTIWQRNREVAARNRALLDPLFSELSETIGWVKPQGGFTCFPWLKQEADATPLCRRLVKEHGVLFAPGSCFGMPAHFRLGFGVAGARFPEALERVRAALQPGSAAVLPATERPGRPRSQA